MPATLTTAVDTRPPGETAASVRAMATDDVGRLVEEAAAGSATAFTALVDRFTRLIRSVTLAFRLNAADAEDVNQTCWLRLAENLSRIHEPDRIGYWLGTTARRECLAVLRRGGRTVPTEDDEQRPDETLTSLDDGLLTGERQRAVWKAFVKLAPRDQALLYLLLTDPPTPYAEIAVALGLEPGSIGPTRIRCLKRLRELLAGSDLGLDDLRS